MTTLVYLVCILLLEYGSEHTSIQYYLVQSPSRTLNSYSTQPDSDQFSVVPDSEFVVSRTAYADNSSIYQLNGKRMQFKEIAALLRESGIDLDHNRFLILQVHSQLMVYAIHSYH